MYHTWHASKYVSSDISCEDAFLSGSLEDGLNALLSIECSTATSSGVGSVYHPRLPVEQVLGQLAPDVSYPSLAMLRIASIQALSMASFEIDDVERLLFFCKNLGKDPSLGSSITAGTPSWLVPPPPSLKRSEPCKDIKPLNYTVMEGVTHRHKMFPFSGLSVAVRYDGDQGKEEFLRDVMQFLILRGHNREVVSRGGFHVGNGINWKGQVSSKMRNQSLTNRMTGGGNTLKRHYESYLLEYELAHDDVDGECCLLCHSAAGDWVKCGVCGERAQFGRDRRQGLGAFKDYAKTDGLEHVCPRCSISIFKKKTNPMNG
ncbi:AT-rich interactive domain-containing protein 4 [Hibiscus syriacus]|uniref:AT-rich interactive domain-containing protein 4 n=1 Tax=Hibiscus syriacus TaxID=106335 RepID=A0A6A2WEX6_HIBSY|nr:AT-rich interactive domain-containing protein 4 [Hibiscus syriacus]